MTTYSHRLVMIPLQLEQGTDEVIAGLGDDVITD